MGWLSGGSEEREERERGRKEGESVGRGSEQVACLTDLAFQQCNNNVTTV
jgi:hypothetical protein